MTELVRRASTVVPSGQVTDSQSYNAILEGLLIDTDEEATPGEDEDTRSLEDEFRNILKDIKSGVVLSATDGKRYETTFSKLDSTCLWLPSLLVAEIPTGKEEFPKFEPLLERLLKHSKCQDFPTWKSASHGETILHKATRKNRQRLISYLCLKFEKAKDGVAEKSSNGLNCFHIAAQLDKPIPGLMSLLLKLARTPLKVTDPGTGGNTPLHLAVDVKNCRPRQQEVVEILLSASQDAIRKENDNFLTPLQYHYQSKASPGFDPTADNSVPSQIEVLLKLSCLRLDIDRDETRKILYNSPTDRREFSFDLFGYDKIRGDDLNNLSKHISFETVLKSVAIPNLTVQPPDHYLAKTQEDPKMMENLVVGEVNGVSTNPPGQPAGGSDDPPECPGRIDYCWIFKWLRDQDQGVTKILRVSVEDRQPKSHSDEAIEWCLKKMDVEILDWNKLDICSTTITNAAPKVRNLTLYCSGNNAVLRSWISPGGLAELEDLKILNLKILLGLESLSRTTAQAKFFKSKLLEERMNWCKKERKIECKKQNHEVSPHLADATCPKHELKVNWNVVGSDGKSVNAESNEDDKRAEAEKQEWIQCMEKFADFIRGYRQDVEVDGLDVPSVKLALIDDGVDGLTANLSRNIKAGETFSERSRDDYNPYFKSTRGHGTIMAMLIRKICPNVSLYVAKLNEEKTGRNTVSITAESAVKAISWAIDHNVDIISMSWTIDQAGDAKIRQKLEEAVNTAVEKGILIFCSVSDQGPQDTRKYPAYCNRGNSFLIGTATISGQAWRWNGTNPVDYILPGTDLEVKIGDELFDSRLKSLSESGSSLATALASGLAALILDCIALNNANEFKGMRDGAHSKMKKAFNSINNDQYDKENDNKYLRVWDTFGRALKDEKGGAREKLEFIVNSLMSKVRQEAGPGLLKANPT